MTPPPVAPAIPTPAPAPLLPVQGRVVDFQTITPLVGATVEISGVGKTVTDSDGRYSLPQSSINFSTSATFKVNGQSVGSGYPRGGNNRAGDVAVDRGNCVMRYGMVLDSKTLLPIVGAKVESVGGTKSKPTDKDGWYELDFLGCGHGYIGFNTTWATASATGYISSNFTGGRGWSGVYRADAILKPQ